MRRYILVSRSRLWISSCSQIEWEEDEIRGVDVVDVFMAGWAKRDAVVANAKVAKSDQALTLEPFKLWTVRLKHRHQICDLRSCLFFATTWQARTGNAPHCQQFGSLRDMLSLDICRETASAQNGAAGDNT